MSFFTWYLRKPRPTLLIRPKFPISSSIVLHHIFFNAFVLVTDFTLLVKLLKMFFLLSFHEEILLGAGVVAYKAGAHTFHVGTSSLRLSSQHCLVLLTWGKWYYLWMPSFSQKKHFFIVFYFGFYTYLFRKGDIKQTSKIILLKPLHRKHF